MSPGGALQAGFEQALAAALAGDRPARIGLAVSGGGDSMALMELAARSGWPLAVASVDHGLRPESADEARLVAARARALGLPHDTLIWDGWSGAGNLQAVARAARRRLLAQWARAQGIGHIALAHTAEDQAETVLMEIARRAGPAGQSGMAARRAGGGEGEGGGIIWLRPLLGTPRAALRDMLRAYGIRWAEDPSNSDLRFARVRARAALAGQAGSRDALIARAARARTRDLAARREASDLARSVTLDRGEMRLPAAALAALSADARHAFLHAALVFLGHGRPGPRGSALRGFEDRLSTGEGGPLHGVMARLRRGQILLCRDAATLSAAPPGGLWDGRWRLDLPADLPPGSQVAPVGAALSGFANRRDLGLSRAALMASPALRVGGRLIAAPLLEGGGAEYCPCAADFADTLLSH